jgi:hypothetical protein
MHKEVKYHVSFTLREKLSSLLLVIILLFNVCGYYIFFNVVQNNIRHDIKEQIRAGMTESELTMIEITVQNEAEIRWIEHNREFTYRGNMYDVVKIKPVRDGKILYCINDIRERKLITDFAKKNESNQKVRKLLSNFSNNFLPQPGMLRYINESSDQDFLLYTFDIQSKIKETADPPPKLIL